MIQFGTGGWRAIIGDGFTKANVRLLTQGLAERMHSEGVAARGTVVGYDRRFLSAEAAQWATEVFAGNGIHVQFVARPVPTPMLMWTVRNLDCAYGIAVTASHNPALYNGIKVFTEGGRDAEAEVTDSLGAAINSLAGTDVRDLPFGEAKERGLVTVQTSMNWYLDSIIDALDLDVIRHRHLQIVLDPMFGVAQTGLQTILMTARCQVDVINDRQDTLFGGGCRRRTSDPCKACGRRSPIVAPISASPPTATPTGSASSTTPATSCTPTRSWCCSTNTCSPARAGPVRPCATCRRPTCSTGWRPRRWPTGTSRRSPKPPPNRSTSPRPGSATRSPRRSPWCPSRKNWAPRRPHRSGRASAAACGHWWRQPAPTGFATDWLAAYRRRCPAAGERASALITVPSPPAERLTPSS